MSKMITHFLLIVATVTTTFSAHSCPYPPAAYVHDMIKRTKKNLTHLKQQQPQISAQLEGLASNLKIQKLETSSLGRDVVTYEKLIIANQDAINQAYYTSELLTEISKECSECLTLEELFDYVQTELPEEYWHLLNPLKTYLSALDEKVEAEKKRLTQALKTFNSDVLIEDLEAELAELTQITDEKKQVLHTATKNITTLQSSYDNTQQRLREINSSIKSEARELEIWIDSKGQTAESQCSRDGTLVK